MFLIIDMRRVIKAVDDLRELVEDLTERVEALEAVQQEPDTEGRGLGLFDWWRRRRPQGENGRHG